MNIAMGAYELAVIIPARNEALRLPRTLRALRTFAMNQHLSRLQVLIADDYSRDGTAQAARSISGPWQLKVVTNCGPPGPGAAIRRALALTDAPEVLVCDADLCVPFGDIARLRAATRAGAHIAIGSRAVEPSVLLKKQPLHRIAIGRVWGRLAQRLVPVGVKDTQCGFKLFDDVGQRILAATQSTSFAFYVEALALARDRGLRISEVAVRWQHADGSRLQLPAEAARMSRDLVATAWRRAWGWRDCVMPAHTQIDAEAL